MNSLCRRPPAPFFARLALTGARVRFICDLRDGISREVCFMGHYEPQETRLVLTVLRPGMCFVDAGANWGYFSLLAADRVGATGRVVSFEPHPELFGLLCENLHANRLSWASALPVALADRPGQSRLRSFAADASNRGVSRLASMDEPGPTHLVRTDRLEAVLDRAGVEYVDLLKMDIEGAEGAVVPTMAAGLASGRYRVILLELHEQALLERGTPAHAVVDTIVRRGYTAWRIDHAPAAFRRAAYRLPDSPGEFLRPFDERSGLDAWPHLVFTAPGIRPPC